ncbi:MAG: biotin--[acetyl-CoA-carboxylase] ligase [Chlamydiae bacterium RIFCSPHIGHO2_12_FULL_49_9]|nr:MAG: biotin--[acetyl-CoA-carboxylase] ligase [Chlamydiae bacterium RIFCSPHIGHO2_12_FULL_49_9]
MQPVKHIHFDTIDSTNSYAKREHFTFAPDEITCITADQQTAGRGRFLRHWISPKDVNLYVTFYFRLLSGTPDLTSIAQMLACTLSRILSHEGLKTKIKWPNDILLNQKKISGVLCETSFSADFAEVFLGIGINVNMSLDMASQIDQPATSLKIETGKTWDRQELLEKLQEAFEEDLEIFKTEGFAPFHDYFEDHLAFKGQEVRCFDGKKEWMGICESIAPDGRLCLRLPDGKLHTLSSGDLFSI